MALLKVEAERLAVPKLIAGMVETIITEDPLYALLDWEGLDTKYKIYNREKSLPTTDFKGPGATINESSGNTEEIVAKLRAIIGDVDVDSFLSGTMSATNNQKAVQIAMKVKATSRKFRDAAINGAAYTATVTSGNPAGFITSVKEVSDPHGEGNGTISLVVATNTLTYTAPGDTAGAGDGVGYTTDGDYILKSGSPSRWIKIALDVSEEGGADVPAIVVTAVASDQFTGLKRFIPETQVIKAGTNGANLSFAMLDELLDGVRGTKTGLIMMPRRTIRAYKALLRTVGGLEPAMVMDPRFGAPVLTYSGVPILENEFISITDTVGSATSVCGSAYAVSLEPGYGIRGLYGGNQAGIQVENIGALETKDAVRTRVKWYTALEMGSELSCARLSGILN